MARHVDWGGRTIVFTSIISCIVSVIGACVAVNQANSARKDASETLGYVQVGTAAQERAAGSAGAVASASERQLAASERGAAAAERSAEAAWRIVEATERTVAATERAAAANERAAGLQAGNGSTGARPSVVNATPTPYIQ